MSLEIATSTEKPKTKTVKVREMPYGFLFFGNLFLKDETKRLYLKTYYGAVDLAEPGDTYGDGSIFYNVSEVRGTITVSEIL